MRYIIMCGGEYNSFEIPRQLSVVDGEELVARTIRLLKENGITDIAISSNNSIFEKFKIPILKHENNYIIDKENKVISGQWFDAFYPTDEPACYIFGDVFFSPEAIKTIVETETDDIELFGSKKPFARNYIKTHEEPFALKVKNQKHLREAIEKSRELDEQHKFWRKPLVWELFTVIKDVPLQTKRDCYTTDYVGISDYTCDIDRPEDVKKMNDVLKGGNMVKVEVIEHFTFGKFDEIKNSLVRFNEAYNIEGHLYPKDTFECNQEIAQYLMGQNLLNKTVIKVIEVVPEKQDTKNKENAPKETTNRTTKSKKIKKQTP